MSEIVGKQAYFKDSNGKEKPVVSMTTPELIEAVSFCKGFLRSCSRRKNKAKREIKLSEEKHAKIGELLDNIKQELKERRAVSSTESLKSGDKIIIKGKEDIYEISDPGDLESIESDIKQGKVYRYE